MRILFLTKYNRNGPSSRYRVYQYLEAFASKGFNCCVSPLFGSFYFSELEVIRVLSIPHYYLRRFFVLFTIRKYDLVYIEYELFPYLPPIFELFLKLIGVKYIVDFDDAIFHNYNYSKNWFVKHLLSRKIDRVIQNGKSAISGSPYLTKYILNFNNKCIEIPTTLSVQKYSSCIKYARGDLFIIGWIGSVSTSINLIKLVPVFRALKKVINYQLNLIGFNKKLRSEFEGVNVEFIDWSDQFEIDEIRKFSVGIMPLEETPFNKGKCGFKLIQYMACSLPTISTPLEANVKINRSSKNLHALTLDDWYKAILEVYSNQKYFNQVGEQNYNDFVKFYSVESNIKTYIDIFKANA